MRGWPSMVVYLSSLLAPSSQRVNASCEEEIDAGEGAGCSEDRPVIPVLGRGWATGIRTPRAWFRACLCISMRGTKASQVGHGIEKSVISQRELGGGV